jgi:hypothetical protein
MRWSPQVLVMTLLGLAVLPYPAGPASASCAAPYLEVSEQTTLERGEAATIEGRAFTGGGCQDSMSCTSSFGCDSCTYDDPPAVPMEDVALRLVQDGRTWDLAVADAGSADDNELGWVTWTFEVPAEADRGPARLLPDNAQSVRIRLR